MPAFLQAAASSFIGSRLNGVDMMPQSVSFVSNMAKPSWCLLVMTMYFMPASLAIAHPLLGVELDGIELVAELFVLRDGHLGLFQDPFAVVLLVLPLARRHGIHAPVDEHAELGLAEPVHAGVVLFFGLLFVRGGDPRPAPRPSNQTTRQRTTDIPSAA